MTPTPRDSSSGGGFAAIAVIAALLAIGAALFEWRTARRAEAAMMAVGREFQEAQKVSRESGAAGSPGDRTASDAAANRDQSAAPASRARPAQTPATAAPSLADQKLEWQRFLLLHPEIREPILGYARQQFESIFGPFLKSIGATPTQVEQLQTAAVQSWFDGMSIGPQGGIRATGDFIPPAAQLRGIFGDQIAQQVQDYDRAFAAQSVASQVATKAAFASAPLSPEQETQLTQTVAANSPDYASGKKVNLMKVDWDTTLTQLGGFLSPEQVQAAQRQILGFQYQSALAQARQAAAGGPP
jgi:hypothetical protein